MDIVSNNENSVIQEAHEVVTTEGHRNTWLNRAVTPGVLIFLC